MSKTGRMRPWHERAVELEESEGAYCDYAAFKEWFTAAECKMPDPGDILGELEHPDDINLYVILCDTFDAMEPETRDEKEQARMESMKGKA